MKAPATAFGVTLTIASTQTALYNLRTAYIAAGHPAGAIVIVTLIINAVCEAGITQGAGWATGSSCIIINNSTSAGTGGAGATGGQATAGSLSGPSAAVDGGDALNLTLPTTLDNSGGYLFAGGGGGGGGGSAADYNPPGSGAAAGGGGGGGGRGYNNATRGTGGSASAPGANGTAGSSTAAGVRGAGGVSFGNYGGQGGDGGGWGESGGAGANGSGPNVTFGGAGAVPGYAIRKNGNSLAITGGNDASRIKGAVL